MGSKIGGGDDDVIADINITPFVDIILVVLIIFMVTATTIQSESIKVALPDAASGEANESKSESLGLTLTTDGRLLLDGVSITPEQLKEELRAAKQRSDEVVCLIAADKAVAHGRVVWLIDLVKSNGIAKFAININKADAVPPDPATQGQGTAPVPGAP